MIINFSSSFKLIDCYIEQYNNIQNGRKDKLTITSRAVLQKILTIYAASLNKTTGLLGEDHQLLPGLELNNNELAQKLCSKRTVQRHIKKLEASGLILEKRNEKWHQNRVNTFKIKLNPLVLFICQSKDSRTQKDVFKGMQTLLLEAFSKIATTTTCPQSYFSNTRELKYITSPVEMLKQHVQIGETNEKGGDKGKLARGDEKIKEAEKNEPQTLQVIPPKENHRPTQGLGSRLKARMEGRGAERHLPDPKRQEEQAAKNRERELEKYIQLLWIQARVLFYDHIEQDEKQIKRIKEKIADFFTPYATTAFKKIYNDYLLRLHMMNEYVNRDPERRGVPRPLVFFDISKKHGFVVSGSWLKKRKRSIAQCKKEDKLCNYIRLFHTNEQKPPENRKDSFKLFVTYEQRLKQLGDERLMQRFYSSVLQSRYQSQLSFSYS